MIRPLLGALALLAIAAPAASAQDAEIFATNNTAVITDPADPRLQDRLKGFARDVERIIHEGGGKPRGSELLDGVFAGDAGLTFERSRVFDVDRVTDEELHTIADTIRARFDQQSVLTFDHLPADSDEVDALLLDVPGVSAAALRKGLQEDAEARDRLFGGSVTLDRHLLLVASFGDGEFARAFAKKLGGDLKRAQMHFGKRAFVEGPLPVRLERGTLVISGSAGADSISLSERFGRLEVELGEQTFAFPSRKVDRVRVDGDGVDTLSTAARGFVGAAGDRVRVGDLELDGVEILKLAGSELVVGDLSKTDTFQVDADAAELTVLGSEDDDQISVGSFGVLGPTYVRPAGTSRLTVDGRGGDDIVSSSVAFEDLTLRGGPGDNVLLGGPGDDHLIGGPGFDDVKGGPGEDVALLGGDFDRFSWKAGDGSDVVDGGASRDSLSVTATNQDEAFTLDPDGKGLRLQVADAQLPLAGIEEVDLVAGGGEDSVAIGDLAKTGAQLVDVSLAAVPITPLGDFNADRISVAGRGALTLAGKVVTSGSATLTGLPWTVSVSHAEAFDTLAISGAKSVDTSGLAPGTIGVELSGP
jgi:hypothetical protein